MPNSDLFVDEFYQRQNKIISISTSPKERKKNKEKRKLNFSYEANNALIRKPDTYSMNKKNYISHLSHEHQTRNLKEKH